MKRMKMLLREPGFVVFIVCLGFVSFGWPFLTVPENASPAASYAGLFTAWIIFIGFLFVLSRR